ncbi:MAG TPA: Fe-S cluster assembly protein SufD [Caulobacteraceae bacterium]|jgi:Fe-S cluster assembly protein SufD|nr:Fe-S cluster assembly protein SufD [Caulobacteraceae bacterium]
MSLAQSIATGDLSRLPSRRDEDWRWTDLRGLIRVAPAASPAWEDEIGAGPFDGLGETAIIVNGRGPRSIEIAAGQSRTIALRLISAPNAGGHASRLRVDVGADASLTLLESHEGLGADYLAAADLDLRIGEGASVERVVLSQEAADGVAVTQAEVTLAPGAKLTQTTIASGARRERLETRVGHPGHGAAVRLDGLYLLTDRRHSDQTTVVTHEGVDGATEQLTKGVVDGQARGVFQGRIVVAPGADRTDARMRHQALVLSDRAEVDAKPELEIFADDVACAHGNTIGALDEEALFYARQRGIPQAEARAMLMRAFLLEVVDRIGHEGARAAVVAFVDAQLGSAPS